MSKELHLKFLIEFILGQGLVFTPILAVLALLGLWKMMKRGRETYAGLWLCTSLPLFAYFYYYGLYDRVQLNWLAPLLFSTLLCASMVEVRQSIQKIALYMGFMLSTLAFIILIIRPFPLPPSAFDQIGGFEKLALDVEKIRKDEKIETLYTFSYTTTAQLRYALKRHDIYQLNEPERYSFQAQKRLEKEAALILVEEKNLVHFEAYKLDKIRLATLNRNNEKYTVFKVTH